MSCVQWWLNNSRFVIDCLYLFGVLGGAGAGGGVG